MDTQQISRLSRKDLQSLHSSLDNLSEFNIESYGRDSFSNHASNRGSTMKSDSDVHAGDDDDDDDELDDFSLHNLRDLDISSHSFNKPSIKDPDSQSNSSSSAASTVIHNPNPNPSSHTKSDNLVNTVSLHTLESDPELQNKLHRTLRLSNINNNSTNAAAGNNSRSNITKSSSHSIPPNHEPRHHHANTWSEDCNDEHDDIIDEIDYYQHENDNDNDNDDGVVDDYGEDNDDDDDDIGSSNSLDSMEDITNDKLTDYIQGMLPSPPSSPPKELDPTKLYALYDFSGPDPSHLPLLKNESVLLLNDSDSYWWLVRKVNNNRIGFAPAEILETYTERLARLNCWKNEILERGGIDGLKIEEEKKLFNTDYPLNHPLLESIPLSSGAPNNDSMISVDNKIERKGSLKKPNHVLNYVSSDSAKKTVSFADINEVKESSDVENGEEEEDIDEYYDIDSIDKVHNSAEHGHGQHRTDEIDCIDENEEASYSLLDGYHNEYNTDEISLPDRASSIHGHTSRGELGSTDSSSITATQPLIVPKKRRNFLIKNLDDYQDSSSSERENDLKLESQAEEAKSRSRSPEVLTPSSSANGNSLESTPTKIALNNVTVSTCSESTDSLQKGLEFKEKKNQDLNISKGRTVEKASGAGETRLASLKMLDDLLETYPEFVGSGKDSSSTSVSASNSGSNSMNNESSAKDLKAQGLAEGYRSSSMSSDIKIKSLLVPELDETETESEFSKSKGSLHMGSDSSIEGDELHPKTMLIFDPLFNQMKELDALLDEMKK